MIEFGSEMGDVESMINMRAWLSDSLVKSGAKITDTGMGMGSADVGIELEGFQFDVSIKPRM